MSDGDAILRSVLLHPEDDAPRLVYADWLQEQGDEWRAKFIRHAIDIARNPDALYTNELRAVLKGLANAHGDTWFPMPFRTCREVQAARRRAVLGGCCNRFADNQACDCLSSAGDYGLDRGFVTSVTLPAQAFMGHAAALFAKHPITAVVLQDRDSWPSNRCGIGEHHWGQDANWGPSRPPCSLPLPLCERLGLSDPLYIVYPTAKAAMVALSDACVAHGRTQAGLE